MISESCAVPLKAQILNVFDNRWTTPAQPRFNTLDYSARKDINATLKINI